MVAPKKNSDTKIKNIWHNFHRQSMFINIYPINKRNTPCRWVNQKKKNPIILFLIKIQSFFPLVGFTQKKIVLEYSILIMYSTRLHYSKWWREKKKELDKRSSVVVRCWLFCVSSQLRLHTDREKLVMRMMTRRKHFRIINQEWIIMSTKNFISHNLLAFSKTIFTRESYISFITFLPHSQ